MGLDTLNEFLPKDTDPVSMGDDAIRETRAATKQSFGLEHFLNGYHKIPSGTTAVRPPAGNLGRLYWNTDRNQLEFDCGDRWAASPQTRSMSGGIIASGPVVYNSGGAQEVQLHSAWIDSGGLANPTYNQVHCPTYDCWVILTGHLETNVTGSLGNVLALEGFNGTAWYAITSDYENIASVLHVCACLTEPAGRQFRLTYTNATGKTATVSLAWLTIATLGAT